MFLGLRPIIFKQAIFEAVSVRYFQTVKFSDLKPTVCFHNPKSLLFQKIKEDLLPPL